MVPRLLPTELKVHLPTAWEGLQGLVGHPLQGLVGHPLQGLVGQG
jgi:hypothetical protein